jgi:hypothetical protein
MKRRSTECVRGRAKPEPGELWAPAVTTGSEESQVTPQRPMRPGSISGGGPEFESPQPAVPPLRCRLNLFHRWRTFAPPMATLPTLPGLWEDPRHPDRGAVAVGSPSSNATRRVERMADPVPGRGGPERLKAAATSRDRPASTGWAHVEPAAEVCNGHERSSPVARSRRSDSQRSRDQAMPHEAGQSSSLLALSPPSLPAMAPHCSPRVRSSANRMRPNT